MPKRNTEAKQRAFLEGVRGGKKVVEVCRELGIARTTPYVWAERNLEFGALWDRARASRLQQLRDVAYEEAMDGNVQLLKYLLGRWWKDEAGAGVAVGEVRIIMPGGANDGDAEFITIEPADN